MEPLSTPTEPYLTRTRQWVERAVIGLNLCPFAKAVHVKGQVRYQVSLAQTAVALLTDLFQALQELAEAPADEVDTILLIHPHVLQNFLDYNDFLEVADAAIEELGLTGMIQIASFHPDYQFADTEPGDISNYTNRSPYPTLHLLREASIARAVAAFPDAASIYQKNSATLEKLGYEGWEALWGGRPYPPPIAINTNKAIANAIGCSDRHSAVQPLVTEQ